MATEEIMILKLPKSLKTKARLDGKARFLKMSAHIRKLIRDHERKGK